MSGKRWKRHERAVAQALGSERNPSNGKRNADIDKRIPFAVEHKTRQAMPQWFTKAVSQAIAGATEGRTPLVVIDYCRGRGHTTERFAVMRFADFVEWHGAPDPVDDVVQTLQAATNDQLDAHLNAVARQIEAGE